MSRRTGERLHITPLEPVRVLVDGGSGAARDVLELEMAPGGVPHAPFNPTDEPARALIIGQPGFVPYFREIGEIITSWPPTEEMMEACGPVMERHGVEMVAPPPLAARD